MSRLRFKRADGLDFGDSICLCLGDVAEYRKSRRVAQEVVYVSTEDLLKDIGGISKRKLTEAEGVEFFKGDILLGNIRPYLKKIWLADCQGVCSADVLVIRSKSIDPSCLFYMLSSEDFFRHMADGYKGSKMPRGDKKQIMEYKLNIPEEIKEQQKIAAFFTALDEKIACEAKRVEKIKLVKKSCLQKIFGEEMHFSDSTPWVETSFGEVSTFVNGRAYAQNELLSRGKYLVLRVGNFFTNSEYYYSDLELDEDKYANDGDLLYAWSASFGPRIWNGGKIIYHYHIWKVVPKNIDKNFLFYALQHDVDGIKGQLNGGTMSHLTKSGIEERVIKIPCDNEQKKIGEFLKLLDEKIVIASRKLEVLVRQKKSFAQQMLI